MDLTLITARLKAQLTGLRSVGASADLEAAMGGLVATPSAFVLPLAEAGSPPDALAGMGQQVVQTFGVVHGIKNVRDQAGSAALEDLAALRANLRAALVGWVPDAATGEAVRFARGRLLKLDGDGRLWWMDEFELTTYYWSA